MRSVFAMMILALVSGCGYSSVKNEMSGQVKKVVYNTPLICPNYVDVDVSLGVMRGGVGSMSAQDIWLTVEDKGDIAKLTEAAKTGRIVEIKYDVKRVTWCINDHIVSEVNFEDEAKAGK